MHNLIDRWFFSNVRYVLQKQKSNISLHWTTFQFPREFERVLKVTHLSINKVNTLQCCGNENEPLSRTSLWPNGTARACEVHESSSNFPIASFFFKKNGVWESWVKARKGRETLGTYGGYSKRWDMLERDWNPWGQPSNKSFVCTSLSRAAFFWFYIKMGLW